MEPDIDGPHGIAVTPDRQPHGSRFNLQGTRHYSACMMDDLLVEIDTATFKGARHFRLTKNKTDSDQ